MQRSQILSMSGQCRRPMISAVRANSYPSPGRAAKSGATGQGSKHEQQQDAEELRQACFSSTARSCSDREFWDLHVLRGSYYDDFPTVTQAFLAGGTDKAVRAVIDLLGFLLSDKEQPSALEAKP